jgi:hypothetical protein
VQVDTSLTILDSAVDWLTVTCPRGQAADTLIARASDLLHQAESAGNRVLPLHFSGYRGWRSVGIAYGRRKDGAIASLSSRAAAMNWKEFYNESTNVTRCDLQITCADSTHNAFRAEIAYHLMQENRKRRGRPISASLRLNSGGGQSLYLGSPKSDIIGRLYDKGVEAKFAPAGACHRFEAQYRREPAKRTIRALYQVENIHDYIATLVVAYFSDRGLAVPKIQGDSAAFEFLTQSYYRASSETDDARSLRWLGTFVASTVRRLIESGKRAEVMHALGLTDADSILDQR